jgi:hypothetical protein
VVEPVKALEGRLEELAILAQMGKEEGEEHVAEDLAKTAAAIDKGIGDLDFRVMLGGPNDPHNAFVQINAGAGGVDACDWAGILLRMYIRWAEARDFKVEEIERTEETEGGIRTATILIQGPYAFGYLKAETGVHRLVRISPFDSQARRHTAFASVGVTPGADEIEPRATKPTSKSTPARGRRGRPARQQDGTGRADDALGRGHGRAVSVAAQPAQVARWRCRCLAKIVALHEAERDVDGRSTTPRARSLAADPLVRDAPVSDGEGPPREHESAISTRCSARSTAHRIPAPTRTKAGARSEAGYRAAKPGARFSAAAAAVAALRGSQQPALPQPVDAARTGLAGAGRASQKARDQSVEQRRVLLAPAAERLSHDGGTTTPPREDSRRPANSSESSRALTCVRIGGLNGFLRWRENGGSCSNASWNNGFARPPCSLSVRAAELDQSRRQAGCAAGECAIAAIG